jgi:hypothetical protein
MTKFDSSRHPATGHVLQCDCSRCKALCWECRGTGVRGRTTLSFCPCSCGISAERESLVRRAVRNKIVDQTWEEILDELPV